MWFVQRQKYSTYFNVNELPAIHLLIDLGNSFKIFGGWFECLLT